MIFFFTEKKCFPQMILEQNVLEKAPHYWSYF